MISLYILAIFEPQFYNSQIVKCEKIFQSSPFFIYHRCHAVTTVRTFCLWIQVSFLPRIACLRQSTQFIVYSAPKSQITLPSCLWTIFQSHFSYWLRVSAGSHDAWSILLYSLKVNPLCHSQMVVFAYAIARFSNKSIPRRWEPG